MAISYLNAKNITKLAILGCFFLITGMTEAATRCDVALIGPQTTPQIGRRSDRIKPHVYRFVKDQPILGFQITSNRIEDLPTEIREALGATDQTTYTPEYLQENIGSIIALQMNGDKKDFHVVGKATFESKYKVVDLNEVLSKNSKLVAKLEQAGMGPLLNSKIPQLVGALKVAPVEMYRMSHLGYPRNKSVTIESPWGEQTKPAGQDAFLTWDQSQNMYYMINTDPSGLPIGYVLSYPDGILSKEFITSAVKNSGARPLKFAIMHFPPDSPASIDRMEYTDPPVTMVKMSQVGFPIEREIRFESPWGYQVKPAGQDAYLTWDATKNQYYMVLADNSGLPTNYAGVP